MEKIVENEVKPSYVSVDFYDRFKIVSNRRELYSLINENGILDLDRLKNITFVLWLVSGVEQLAYLRFSPDRKNVELKTIQ